MTTRPAAQQASRFASVIDAASAEAATGLEQQLARCWQYLGQQAVAPLPEPLPAAILLFSMAAADCDAAVFHAKGESLAQAWRSGARRARHWAWRHRAREVVLRVDWAEDVTMLADPPPAPAGAQAPSATARVHAFINHRFDRVVLWGPYFHGVGLAPSPRPLPPRGGDDASGERWLALHLRGVCCTSTPADPLVALPRPALPMPHATPGWHPLPVVAQAQAAASEAGRARTPSVAEQAAQCYAQWCLAAATAAAPSGPARQASALVQRVAAAPWQGSRLEAGMTALVLMRLAASGTALAPRLRIQAGQSARHLVARALAWQVPSRQPDDDDAGESLRATRLVAALAAAFAATLGGAAASPRPHDRHAAILAFMARSAPLAALRALRGMTGMALRIGWHESLHGLADHDLARLPQHDGGLTAATLAAAEACAHRLQQIAAWPEHTLYLPPEQRLAAQQQAFPMLVAHAHASHRLAPPPQQAQVQDAQIPWAHVCIAWRLGAMARPMRLALVAQAQATAGGGAVACPAQAQAAPLPAMAWDVDSLARLTRGRWHHLDERGAAMQVRGVHVHRPTAWPGAATALRSSERRYDVAPRDAQQARPAVLLVDALGPQAPQPRPTLLVPDVPLALVQLALAARQRVPASVVAVLGCAGKSTCIHMLLHALGCPAGDGHAALLQQSAALQLVNASDRASTLVVELALPDIASDIALVCPDVVVVTSLPHSDDATSAAQAGNALLGSMRLIKRGATVIAPLRVAALPQVRQLAASRQLRLLSCGADAQAQLGWRPAPGRGDAAFTMQLPQCRELAVTLAHPGEHMLENAALALAALWALGADVAAAAPRLAHWRATPGAGVAESLDDGITLLDHSQARHTQALRCGLAQLHAVAPQAQRRLIVLCAQKGEEDFVQSLLHEAPVPLAARRVLAWGDALRPLVGPPTRAAVIQWYADLGHLADSLVRTLQPHDTVLLVGGARWSQALVAQAMREHLQGLGNGLSVPTERLTR